MKRKSSVIIAVALVAVLVVAVYAYNKLSDNFDPDSGTGAGPGSSGSEPGAVQDPAGNGTGNAQDTDGSGTGAEQDPAAQEKSEAPDFTFIDGAGKEVKLSDFQGKPVVLNFWASWCSPCKSEMHIFNDMYLELGSDIQFVMLALTDGQRETIETASEFVESMGYSFPVYFDYNLEGARSFVVQSIPTTFFIDKNGYLVNTFLGRIEEQALRDRIALISSD